MLNGQNMMSCWTLRECEAAHQAAPLIDACPSQPRSSLSRCQCLHIAFLLLPGMLSQLANKGSRQMLHDAAWEHWHVKSLPLAGQACAPFPSARGIEGPAREVATRAAAGPASAASTGLDRRSWAGTGSLSFVGCPASGTSLVVGLARCMAANSLHITWLCKSGAHVYPVQCSIVVTKHPWPVGI